MFVSACGSMIITLLEDKRITCRHISMLFALLYCWQQNSFENPILITRRDLMKLAHIRSTATYHRCVKELDEFGYIVYLPNFNPYFGSKIRILLSYKVK